MANERAVLCWSDCVAIQWEDESALTLHMINNLFCNKGRRPLNCTNAKSDFFEKNIEISLTNDLTDWYVKLDIIYRFKTPIYWNVLSKFLLKFFPRTFSKWTKLDWDRRNYCLRDIVQFFEFLINLPKLHPSGSWSCRRPGVCRTRRCRGWRRPCAPWSSQVRASHGTSWSRVKNFGEFFFVRVDKNCLSGSGFGRLTAGWVWCCQDCSKERGVTRGCGGLLILTERQHSEKLECL